MLQFKDIEKLIEQAKKANMDLRIEMNQDGTYSFEFTITRRTMMKSKYEPIKVKDLEA